MSKDRKKSGESVKSISRRGLLGTAALALGAATSAVAARSALARSADVTLDAQGRVVVDGNVIRIAAKKTGDSATGKKMESQNEKCTNVGCAASPTAAKPTTTKKPTTDKKQ